MKVSILVLVEGTLQLVIMAVTEGFLRRFNPCFSGRYSAMKIDDTLVFTCNSFNPCFSGRYSAIGGSDADRARKPLVSILVLVEGTLQLHKRFIR